MYVMSFSVYLVTINNYSTNKAKLKFEFEVAYISKLMQGPLIITISVRGGGQEADPPNFSEIENSGRKTPKIRAQNWRKYGRNEVKSAKMAQIFY